MAVVRICLSFVLMCCSLITASSQLISESLIMSSFQDSLQMVNDELNQTAHGPAPHPSPSQMFMISRRASSEAQHVCRSAAIFHTTLTLLKERTSRRHRRSVRLAELLSQDALERIANLSGCPQTSQPTTCASDGKYRSISGVCNNRKSPFWGSANSGLARWLPAEYEDGEKQPRGWNAGRQYSGFQLPPVGEVSARIMRGSSAGVLQDSVYSQMLVDWGQYISHDMSFTPQSSGHTRDCLNSCANAEPCFPIQIPKDEKVSRNKSCLPFFRSSAACVSVETDGAQALQRQQLNSATSFIDASTVYGHSTALEETLRNHSSVKGLLAVNTDFSDGGRAFLPFVSVRPSACLQEPEAERVECFTAGDSRVNEILPLSVLHTLWVREHNRLAQRLTLINPHWGSEVVYQETRKIVGALHQIITMRDYIPKIIGQEAVEQLIGPYKGYDESVNPSVSNVFATAAFRFGHASVSPRLWRLNESFQEDQIFPSLSLTQSFFSPWRLIREGGLDPVLRGLLARPAVLQNHNQLMTDELRQRLVVLNVPHALDLASLNLQRGRDHGLPGYNAWRVFCGLARVESRADLLREVGSDTLVEKILALYTHPDNIDVWLGGLMERPLSGARTGPLFTCLIAEQMRRLRDGDRLWWENPGVFSVRQRRELQTHSLSRLVCDNSGLNAVPLQAFRTGPLTACESVPALDLEAWREQPDHGDGKQPPH